MFRFKPGDMYNRVILMLSGIYNYYNENNKEEARKTAEKLYEEISKLNPTQFLTYFLMLLDVMRKFGDEEKVIELLEKALKKFRDIKDKEVLLRLKVELVKSKVSHGGISFRALDNLFEEFLNFAYETKNVILLLSYATGIHAPLYLAAGEDEYVVETLNDTLSTVDEIVGEIKPKDVLPYLAETLTLLSEIEYKLGKLDEAAKHILGAARAFHESDMTEEAIKALKNYLQIAKLLNYPEREIRKVLYEFYDIIDDELKRTYGLK